MKPRTVAMGLLTSLWLTSPTLLPAQETPRVPAAKASAVPEELRRFSGMMIGKLVQRDIERGNFTVTVDYVARVWENNKARNPRAAVGKTFRVEGVSGQWLDQLLLVRPGESIEFEAQHRQGDAFRFPGEWLKKVAPYDPAQHPVPPEGFRGFSGVVVATIEEKRIESRELVLTIREIKRTFEKNQAKEPEQVKDKKVVLAGFWARMSKPFDPLKKGDMIEAGVLHRVPQSDHFTVIEYAKKVSPEDESET